MFHLDQLAYLREAARAESWSQAAQNMHISQPALSQSLRELERRVGVSLFERVGRKQRLTSMGEELLAFAKQVLSQTERFSGRLEALERGMAGKLRVGMIDAAALYAMPEAIREFQRQFPEVELHLRIAGSAALLRALATFEIDLAIVVGPVDASGFRERDLAREKMRIYKPRRGRQGPTSWVLYPSGSHTRTLIDAALHARGILPSVMLESGNPQVLRQMVAMGFGWAVLPEAVVLEHPSGVQAAEDRPLVERQVVAVERLDAPKDLRIERLLALAG